MQKRALYIPTDEDIYNLQKLKENNDDTNKIDIYGYLVTKAIEKLINDLKFLRYPNMPILEITEIIHGVCLLYPQEIYNSEYAKYDANLCQKLITRKIDESIESLDSLGVFAPSVQYNREIMSSTIRLLDEKLVSNPRYRFTYKENDLLDSIFGVDYKQFEMLSYSDIVKLIGIEPIYALKFDSKKIVTENIEPDEKLINYRRGMLLAEGLRKFKKRYDISEYVGYDYYKIDMTNPKDEKVKKLIKYLHS